MYSNLYITYDYKRTAHYVNGQYEPEIEIKLQRDNVSFKEDHRCAESSHGIRAKATETSYIGGDHGYGHPDLDEYVVQEIEIDAERLVESDYLYVPCSHTDVTDEIYYDQYDALEQLDHGFHHIKEYEIFTNSRTFNITLEFRAFLLYTNVKFPLTGKKVRTCIREYADGKKEYICAPCDSLDEHKQKLKLIAEYKEAEDAAKKVKEDVEDTAKRAAEEAAEKARIEAEERAAVVDKLMKMSTTELKTLIK